MNPPTPTRYILDNTPADIMLELREVLHDANEAPQRCEHEFIPFRGELSGELICHKCGVHLNED